MRGDIFFSPIDYVRQTSGRLTLNTKRMINRRRSNRQTNHLRLLSPHESSEIINWGDGGSLQWEGTYLFSHIDYVRQTSHEHASQD
jgi:hypothetical protein